MLPPPAEVRLQVTKYNHALRADSTKYLLSQLAVRRPKVGLLTTLRFPQQP